MIRSPPPKRDTPTLSDAEHHLLDTATGGSSDPPLIPDATNQLPPTEHLRRTRAQQEAARQAAETRALFLRKLQATAESFRKLCRQVRDIYEVPANYDEDRVNVLKDLLNTRMDTLDATAATCRSNGDDVAIMDDLENEYVTTLATISAVHRRHNATMTDSSLLATSGNSRQPAAPHGAHASSTPPLTTFPDPLTHRNNLTFVEPEGPIDLRPPVHHTNVWRQAPPRTAPFYSHHAPPFIPPPAMRNSRIDNLPPYNTNPFEPAPWANYQLPPIQIPCFSGKSSEWLTFSSLFESLIVNRPMDDIQRFYYLRMFLRDEPYRLIEHIPPSNQSFDAAWTLLKSRYNNQSTIINEHLTAFFDIPVLQRPTSVALRLFTATARQNLTALRTLNVPLETFLVYSLARKLDFNTRRAFETEQASRSRHATVDDLTKFLDARASVLESIGGTSATTLARSNHGVSHAMSSPSGASRRQPCPACNNDQCLSLHRCDAFLKLNVLERRDLIRRARRCFNCMGFGHGIGDCKSQSTCRSCQQRHHTYLHLDATLSTPHTAAVATHEHEEPTPESLAPTIPPSVNFNCNRSVQVLLATAMVSCEIGPFENRHVRSLCDSGSQMNLITRQFAEKLRLPFQRSPINIGAVDGRTTVADGIVELTFSSTTSSFRTTIMCAVVESITSDLPQQTIDVSALMIPAKLALADPKFHEPAPVGLLLGAQVCAQAFKNGILHLGDGLPTLHNTALGWLIMGSAPIRGQRIIPSRPTTLFCSNVYSCTNDELHSSVERFWKLDEVPITDECRPTDELAEKIFCDSLVRVGKRLQVDLLFKTPEAYKQLGDSLTTALRRFLWLEKKLHSDPALFSEYQRTIREYVDLGHASIIPLRRKSDVPTGEDQYEYYHPHHAVIKESSSTTKVRVVFDASAPTSTKISLNDTQLVGRPVQSELFDIILNFRMFKYATTADVEKLYRQFLINPSHRRFQRILWRDHPSLPLQCLQLNTVTFGVASAPFLATRALQHIADTESAEFPDAARILRSCVYVDDFLFGADDVETLTRIQRELRIMLSKYDLNLRKWCVSDAALLKDLPAEDVECSPLELPDGSSSVKTLGVMWNPKDDRLSIRCSIPVLSSRRYTKRILLAELMSIFDPLGFVSPAVLKFKQLIQHVWMEKLEWDDPVAEELCQPWIDLMQDLPALSAVEIPRWVYCGAEYSSVRIVGFCDASSIAIGACFYVVGFGSTETRSTLLCAKGKILPKKLLTIPAAELEAALLLSKLYAKIAYLLPRHQEVLLYSDSEITLGRITSSSLKLDKLVGPRVHRIRQLTAKCKWAHVPTAQNPADIVSRGITPSKLRDNVLWWNGPDFIRKKPVEVVSLVAVEDPRHESLKAALDRAPAWCEYFRRFSSLPRLLRIISYLRRIADRPSGRKRHSSLVVSAEELDDALMFVVHQTQLTVYKRTYQQYLRGQPFDDSSFKGLYPFIDGNFVLRVSGRLQNTDLPYATRHPALLPAVDAITSLIFVHEHQRMFHASPTVVLNQLRSHLWPIGGRRNAIRALSECLDCHKSRPRAAEQLMGSLPSERVTPNRAFESVAVDFAGPVEIRQSRVRKTLITKGFIAVFVCLVTRAIHIELVSSLSTEQFILCLNRFISRRSRPSLIISDNGTNFRGANNLLRQLHKQFLRDEVRQEILQWAASNRITWRFNPPLASHMGGLHEAGVKSVKTHLSKLTQRLTLTYEELYTTLVQIEAIVNSRPIAPTNDSPTDYQFITPGHFLVHGNLSSYPAPSLEDININRLKFWRQCQHVVDRFWRLWSRDVLHQYQVRAKWTKPTKNLSVGDLVIVKDDYLPCFRWQTARIIDTYPGRDGLVRTVKIRTPHGEYTRPITRLCPFPDATPAST